MDKKKIDLSQSVHRICSAHPDIIPILEQLGFTDIVKSGMLQTAGRFMTIPKGAALKKIDLDKIKQTIQNHGYHIKQED